LAITPATIHKGALQNHHTPTMAPILHNFASNPPSPSPANFYAKIYIHFYAKIQKYKYLKK
jgi:hypothetical protein